MILFLLLFSFLSTICAFVLMALFSGLSTWMVVVSLLLGLFFAKSRTRSLLEAAPELKLANFAKGDAGILELMLAVFVIYISGRHFLWLFFPVDHDFATLSATNYGDLPLHINYIRELAHLTQFPPLNPSFASEPLLYPLGSDLFSALWDHLHVPLTSHLFIVGVVGTVASVILLRALAGWWGIGAFFLNGGFAGWAGLFKGNWQDTQSALDWKNLFLAVFLPQRGMQFALPAGLLLLYLVRRHFAGQTTLSKRAMTTLGILWGVLALFHLHAFFIVSIILAAYALIERGRSGLKELFTSRLFIFAFPIATYFVFRSSRGGATAKVTHWDFAWTSTGAELGQFLWLNFGAWLFLPIALALFLWPFSGVLQGRLTNERLKQLRWEFVLYTVLFALFFNLMLAPWAWDNVKLLIWPYLGFARLAYVVIEPLFAAHWKKTSFEFVRYAVAFALLISGFFTLVNSVQMKAARSLVLYKKGELAYTQGALAQVPMSAIFAAAPSHLHTLTYFGRLRAVGYEGHLWSHGIDAKEQVERLKRLMSSAPDPLAGAPEGSDTQWKEAARGLGITHIFWGPSERQQYGEGVRPWMSELKNISRVPGYEIYEFK